MKKEIARFTGPCVDQMWKEQLQNDNCMYFNKVSEPPILTAFALSVFAGHFQPESYGRFGPISAHKGATEVVVKTEKLFPTFSLLFVAIFRLAMKVRLQQENADAAASVYMRFANEARVVPFSRWLEPSPSPVINH